jgi:peptidyl-dipeptidase Dcp
MRIAAFLFSSMMFIPVAWAADTTPVADVFARPSPLPFQYPPFDRIHNEDFAAAFAAAMAEHDRELANISKQHDAPSFDNVVLALEKSGQRLHRVERAFFNLLSSTGDAQLQKIEPQIQSQLSRHYDGMVLNPTLFARLDAVHRSAQRAQLDPESRQLLERTYANFVHQGARLKAPDRKQLEEINARLATLGASFRQAVLGATQAGAVEVGNAEDLSGLDTARISAAAAAAAARGLNGKWLITLEKTTDQNVLGLLSNRALRERIYRASIERGSGGQYDTRAIVAETVSLRAEKARLIGFSTYAAFSLSAEGAATPEAANKLLDRITDAVLQDTRKDAAALQALMDLDRRAAGEAPVPLQPWDWGYYSEKLRKQRVGFDQSEVKAYFELNRVLQDGVFYAAHELFGLTFKERKDLPTYAPEVRVFDVYDDHGTQIAIFLADYFARDTKEGGAWMDNFVEQSSLFGTRPVVINNLNIPKPESGQPVLLSFDEVGTIFHEFGHALHSFMSSARYQSLAGTNVPADFVEYPSQCNEMWGRDPGVVAHFAHHYQTGAPMPPELLHKVIAGQQFNGAFLMSEYVVAAILDMAWHSMPAGEVPAAADVQKFESQALAARHAAYQLAPPRYHTTYFLHSFEDEHYAAGYYAYLWSEVLARDTGKWLYEHGGLSRTAGDVYREKVLSRGRTEEPAVLFKNLYGADPDIEPLIEYHAIGGR